MVFNPKVRVLVVMQERARRNRDYEETRKNAVPAPMDLLAALDPKPNGESK